jgi:hypothetical protein
VFFELLHESTDVGMTILAGAKALSNIFSAVRLPLTKDFLHLLLLKGACSRVADSFGSMSAQGKREHCRLARGV